LALPKFNIIGQGQDQSDGRQLS